MSISVSEPKKVGSRELFEVTLPSGTIIKDCYIATKDDSKWVAGPSRSYVNKEGKTIWINLVSFSKHDQDQIFLALVGGASQEEPPFDDSDVPF